MRKPYTFKGGTAEHSVNGGNYLKSEPPAAAGLITRRAAPRPGPAAGGGVHLAEGAATAVAGRREQAVTRTRAQSARPGRRASRTLTFFLTIVKLHLLVRFSSP